MSTEAHEFAFEAWWERSGQYHRAGGGDYEKTFAYHAWMDALASSQEERKGLSKEQISAVYRAQRISFTVPGDYDEFPATWMNTDSLKKLVRAVERAHGIGDGKQAQEGRG